MKPLNEIGCPEMILLFIPVILYGLWYNWKEEKNKQLAEEEVKRQNRDRERNSSTPSRRGSESLEKRSTLVKRAQSVRHAGYAALSTPVTTANKITNEVVNIAPDVTDTSWFLCTHKDLPAPSTAESLIIEELSKYQIQWHREVSFKGLQFTPYSWPRYDFYLPILNTVIEYDGRSSHSNDVQIATDKAKDKFCHDNGITIIRYNAQHYYNMYGHINALMKSSGIKKK